MSIKKSVMVAVVAVLMVLSFNLSAVQAAPQAQMPVPGQFYVVRPGDTMYSIAGRFHTTVWAIARANGIVNPGLIFVGQVLLIPAPSPFPPAPQPTLPVGGPMVHVVRYGETLFGIARLYGVSAWQIAYANGLVNPNYIYAGQRLIIPVRMPAPSLVYNPCSWGGSCYPGPMPYGASPVRY